MRTPEKYSSNAIEKAFSYETIERIKALEKKEREKIAWIYVYADYMRKIRYYLEKEDKLNKTLQWAIKTIEAYLEKLQKLLSEVELIKYENIDALYASIEKYMNDLTLYLRKFTQFDPFSVLDFNYMLWFIYNFFAITHFGTISQDLIYSPKELFITDFKSYNERYKTFFLLLLKNVVVNFWELSCEHFIFFLHHPDTLAFNLENIGKINISQDEIELYLDQIVDFKVSNFLYSQKNSYYLYRKQQICIFDFQKLNILFVPFAKLDFETTYEFFSNQIFTLSAEEKKPLNDLFQKIHAVYDD